MFGAEEGRIFGLPPGVDFAKALISGLLHRTRDATPEMLCRTVIFTNTQRAARRIEAEFTRHGALLLPKIRVIPDLARDRAGPVDPVADAPPLARQLAIMQLVSKLLEQRPTLAPKIAAFDLTLHLESLLDEMLACNVPIKDLIDLDVGDLTEHRETTLAFLRIIAEIVTDGPPPMGSEARLRQVVDTLSGTWASDPIQTPVIVAGSTGSRPTTAALMRAVAALPQGAVVLPGFDFEMGSRAWEALTKDGAVRFDHPQYGFFGLGQALGFSPKDVRPWIDDAPVAPERNRLISLALRAAPVTDEWFSGGPALIPELPEATAGLSWMDAPNGRMEAAAISVAIRDAMEMGKSAVLITPDGTLTRRVSAYLGRWGIVPDESAGTPLTLSPPAVFLSLVLAVTDDVVSVPDFIAILKHPLTASGADRGAHMRNVRRLEKDCLRTGAPYVDWTRIAHWGTAQSCEEWVAWLRVSFAEMAHPDETNLAALMDGHRRAAIALCAGPGSDDASDLWDLEAGRLCRAVLDTIGAAGAESAAMSMADYRAILFRMLAAERVREEGYRPDSRVAIWGQLEARVQSADLVILGGLNEGVWPSQPPPDPWLNRQMRLSLGLLAPDRTIGLSAHDFQQAIANADVIISRSARDGTAPTVASRWLTRLENLLSGLGEAGQASLDDMQQRGQHWISVAAAIDRPNAPVPPEPRPCPAPPLAARPNRISATQVEKLVRDPYAFYASKVLNLYPMDPPSRDPNAMDRGIALHDVMEAFISQTAAGLPPDAENVFVQTAQKVLSRNVPWAAQARLWTARLARVAPQLIKEERLRRLIAEPFRSELRGQIDVPGLIRPLSLVAQADRIDRTLEGQLAIYDYKANLPTDKQEKIFSRQLPLEAIIAERGGFDGIGKAGVLHLELIGLNVKRTQVVLEFDGEYLADVWEKFRDLMAQFELETTGYAARLYPYREDSAGEYDHLARRGEWQDGADFATGPVG